ncbi:MAG: hypothetical protein IPK82_34800 [Polyangiaceae bacterium]|nr:hypothetical protein [Polyangiaceae bacterium]
MSVGSIIGSALLFLFGVLLLRSATGTITVVRLRGSAGEVVLPVGRPVNDADAAALRERLHKELDYPPTPPPPPE